jgi:hypothetical protein
MEKSTEHYLAAVKILRDQAQDAYDRAYWTIELETQCSLSCGELHKRATKRAKRKT